MIAPRSLTGSTLASRVSWTSESVTDESDCDRHPGPPGPPALVRMALARGDRARRELAARRAGGHGGRLARTGAAAPRHARPDGERDRLGGFGLHRGRGARRALLRPARRPARPQAHVPGHALGLPRRHGAHRVHLEHRFVRVLPLPHRLRHRRRVRGDQLGDRRAHPGAPARPGGPRDQRHLLDRRGDGRRSQHRPSIPGSSAPNGAGASPSAWAASSPSPSCWCGATCPRARAGC